MSTLSFMLLNELLFVTRGEKALLLRRLVDEIVLDSLTNTQPLIIMRQKFMSLVTFAMKSNLGKVQSLDLNQFEGRFR